MKKQAVIIRHKRAVLPPVIFIGYVPLKCPFKGVQVAPVIPLANEGFEIQTWMNNQNPEKAG